MTKVNGENIEISTEEVMNTISVLDESLSLLEGTMSTSIANDFTVLSSLDLFSDGIAKLKEQITSLQTSNKNLMSKITVHAEEIEQLEQNIVEEIERSYVSNYGGGGSSGGGGYYADITDEEVEEVTGNTNILESDLLAKIPDMKDIERDEFISFMNINKGTYSMNDLLFSDVGAGMLVYLLKKFYGDTNDNLSQVSTSTSYDIQKALLEKILSSQGSLDTVFKKDSILIAKDYFVSVAKECNLSVSELLLNDKHKALLMSSIRDLYNNENLSGHNVKAETVAKVQDFINDLAYEKQVNVETLLNDSTYLSSLKGV